MADYKFDGDIAFKTKLLELLTTNETGGKKTISPYELIWAQDSRSGWSFGEVQYDLGQRNLTGRTTFVDILLNAKDSAGNYIIDDGTPGTARGTVGAIADKEVDRLFQGAKKKGGGGPNRRGYRTY